MAVRHMLAVNPTESLLSNIPLDEYIYLAVNYSHPGSPGLKISNADLNTPITDTFCIYSCFYDQIDLAAIGFPLSPLLIIYFPLPCFTCVMPMTPLNWLIQ